VATTTSRGADELAAPLDLLWTSSGCNPPDDAEHVMEQACAKSGPATGFGPGVGADRRRPLRCVEPGNDDRRFARCEFMNSETTFKHHNGGPALLGPAAGASEVLT